MLRARLSKIKILAAAKILPVSTPNHASLLATVCAFPFSYSVGRRLVETCRELGIDRAKGRVLIVGAFGGRDYTWLRGFGYKPEILDLGHYDWGKADYVGDACLGETWSKIPRGIDLVVFNDVLEHLPEDFRALRHAHEALSPDGHVYLSVPFRHDLEPTHVRSYSEKSIENLLAAAGFRITWKRLRPGWLEAWPSVTNAMNYGLAAAIPGKTLGARLLVRLLDWEYWINDLNRWLYQRFGRSPQLGVTIVCEKDSPTNYVESNTSTFIHDVGP